jgi:S1-C subfamily serine protease
MYRVLVAFLCLGVVATFQPIGASAQSLDRLFEEFDARALDPVEVVLVQGALATTGDYRAGLDGAWGNISQNAIDGYAWREFQDLPLNAYAAVLVSEFLDDIEYFGWEFTRLEELDLSLALPVAVLGHETGGDGAHIWASEDEALVVETQRQDLRGALKWHLLLEGDAVEAAWSVRGANQMITGGIQADGAVFYSRSDRTPDGWSTVHVSGGPDQAGMINLIAVSITRDAPVAWEVPEGGILAGLLDATAVFFDEAKPEGGAAPDNVTLAPAGDEALSTGTAFSLGENLLVTAGHVVSECERITLADGTELELLAQDDVLDVAALAAPRPAATWLRISGAAQVRLGQPVHAVGFPYYALTGTALNLTSGNVSALAGMDDDRRYVSFTAPVQPGNSGGPLIDGSGGVAGVVIARLSDEYIAETTGSLPQNVNFALSNIELMLFLKANGLHNSGNGLAAFDMDQGAPAEIENAVVPVICL